MSPKQVDAMCYGLGVLQVLQFLFIRFYERDCTSSKESLREAAASQNTSFLFSTSTLRTTIATNRTLVIRFLFVTLVASIILIDLDNRS
jgi:hypothetical protein